MYAECRFKKCLVSELIDKTIYLTKLMVGADAFSIYEDEHMIVSNPMPEGRGL